ncbi:hypothetical protein BTN82_15230 [Pseudomonas chlororaphis]|uniref:Fimbrial-type adhesion domain-containing protein n=2 Tax=Pseudomonas chlororaphis TaxID=587753 RepID=A0A1Q8EPU1_9PSED|nr:hypothetical protein BTN82_15230 [Pseudomonas chlororaphis]
MSASAFSFGVKGATCTLNIPNSQVALKKIMMGDLPAVDSVAAAGSFRLTINCGANTPAYTVGMKLVDVADPANSSTNISFVTTDSKSGYALQLLDGENLMRLGADGNNLLGKTAAGGDVLNKMFDVRYVRTGQKIVPGKGTAAINISLTHQ